MPRDFTTGQAAKLCKISQQTIIRCFDNGMLKGYRVPGSRFRRIPRDELFAFMREHKIPIEDQPPTEITVLAVTPDEGVSRQLSAALTTEKSFVLTLSAELFDAGLKAQAIRPDAMVIDCSFDILEAREISRVLLALPGFDRTFFCALSPKKRKQTNGIPPCIEVFEKPFDADLLAERIATIVTLRREDS